MKSILIINLRILWLSASFMAMAICMTDVAAKPVRLSKDAQTSSRKIIEDFYNQAMEQGGFYNELKQNPHPALRILDCFNELCLVEMALVPDFSSSLMLVQIEREAITKVMQFIQPYGQIVRAAAFVHLPGIRKSVRSIYVTSGTRMSGTRAEQLFDFDNQGKLQSFALRTTPRGRDDKLAPTIISRLNHAKRQSHNLHLRQFEF